MKALLRQIVRVIRALAMLSRPLDQRATQTFAHLLRLLIEQLLRHLLPHETQIAHHRDQPQPHRFSLRQQKWTFVTIMVVARQEIHHRPVCQIARRENVWHWSARHARSPPRFCKVRFNESAVASREFTKGMQRFDDARTLRPTTARAGGKRDHRHLSRRHHLAPDLSTGGHLCRGCALEVHHIPWLHILDFRIHRQAILSEPDTRALEVGTNLFVLRAIKSKTIQKFSKGRFPPVPG